MAQELYTIIRLRVQREAQDPGSAFGYGTALLLQGIEELHSLNRAAKRMGMAYSKAWTSIRATEEHLGFQLIERQAQHGSILTEQGKRFLDCFLRAEAAAEAAAEAVFREWQD